MKLTKILENINNIDLTHSTDDELLNHIKTASWEDGREIIKALPAHRNISDDFAIKLRTQLPAGNGEYLTNALIKSGYNPPESVMMGWIKYDPGIFEYMVNRKIPPHNVQLAAISKNGFLVKSLFLKGYIPHDDVILAAIKNKSNIGAYIKKHIPFPSKVVADALYERTKGKYDLRSVARDHHPVRSNFNDWTEEELERLVKHIDANSLITVFESLNHTPSINIQKIAAKRNGYIIGTLPKPVSTQVIDIALKNQPRVINHIDNPTIDQQKIAVTADVVALEGIKHPSKEVIDIAINKAPVNFIYFLNPKYITDELQLTALNNDTTNFKVDLLDKIPDPSPEFLELYSKKYGTNGYQFLKKRNLLTKELLNNILTSSDNFKTSIGYQNFNHAIHTIFADNSLLLNKWLRYGEKMRSEFENN
jgi:hypothetical protein